jgi:hypothetical protein
MGTHHQQGTQPPGGAHEGPIHEVVYHVIDAGGDTGIERRLNEAFDVLFEQTSGAGR